MTSISSYGTGAAKAVHALLQLTRMDCGGSGAAAAVLLSAYNGHDYNLDITELCRLDQHYYQAAMRVIDLRCRLRIEPHLLIQNGDEVFQKLAADWRHLHVNYSSQPGIEGEIPDDWPVTEPLAPECDFLCSIAEEDIMQKPQGGQSR